MARVIELNAGGSATSAATASERALLSAQATAVQTEANATPVVEAATAEAKPAKKQNKPKQAKTPKPAIKAEVEKKEPEVISAPTKVFVLEDRTAFDTQTEETLFVPEVALENAIEGVIESVIESAKTKITANLKTIPPGVLD